MRVFSSGGPRLLLFVSAAVREVHRRSEMDRITKHRTAQSALSGIEAKYEPSRRSAQNGAAIRQQKQIARASGG